MHDLIAFFGNGLGKSDNFVIRRPLLKQEMCFVGSLNLLSLNLLEQVGPVHIDRILSMGLYRCRVGYWGLLSNSKFCCVDLISVWFCFLHVKVIRLCCLFQKTICIGNIDAVTTHFLRK